MPAFLSSLRFRVIFIVLLSFALSFLLFLHINFRHREIKEAEIREECNGVVQLAAMNLEKAVSGTHQLLIGISRAVEVNSRPEHCGPFLRDVMDKTPGYANLGVIDLNGDVICSALPLKGPVNLADRSYFQRTIRENRFSVGEYQIGRITGVPTINFGYPFHDRSEKVKGVVFAAVNLEWFDRLAAEVRLPKGGVIHVIDRGGRILARRPEPEKWVGRVVADSDLFISMTAKKSGSEEAQGFDNIRRIFSYKQVRLADADIYVGVGFSEKEGLNNISVMVNIYLLVIALLALAVLAAVWNAGKLLIIRPIGVMTDAAKKIEAGDYTVRTGLPYKRNEFGELAEAIDDMAASLVELKQEEEETANVLRKDRQLVERIMETSPAGITVVNRDGKITFANYWAEQVLGLKKDEITQLTYNDPAWHITDYDGNPISDEKLPFRKVISSGQAIYDARHAIQCPDGRRVLLSINAAPLLDEIGRVEGMVATVDDITKRVAAEMMLKESEAKYRSLFEHAPDGIFISDREGNYVDVNENGARMLSYTRNEIVRLRILDVVAEEELLRVGRELSEAGSGGPYDREWQFKRKDGSIFRGEVFGSIMPDGNIMGILRDITERKRAEEALISVSKFPDENPNPVMRVAVDGTLLYANDSSLSLMEAWDCRVGRLLPDHIHELASETLTSGLGRELKVTCGKVIYSLLFTPIKGAGYVNIYGRDITEVELAKESLRKSKELLQSIMDNSTAEIYLKDMNGRFIMVNRRCAALFHLTPEQMIGKTDSDIFPKDAADVLREHDRAILENRRPVQFEEKMLYPDGTIHTNLSLKFPLIGLNGTPYATGGISTDITDRKRMEDELVLLYTLIQEISLSEDFRSAIEITLRKICEATGWVMGEAWVPSSDRSRLECSPAWYGDIEGLKNFRKISEGFRFLPGTGLPGRAWSSRKPAWVRDVTLDSNFPRAPYAREAGLKGAMAIPILAGDEVVAVMDFFVTEPKEEDRRLVELVSTIASYMGIIFQRKQAEEEIRKLYHAVEQSPASIFITDAAGKIEYVNPKFIEITGYGREEAIGKKPDIISSGVAAISNTEWHGEFLGRKKSGEAYWEYSIISPIRNTEGEITNFIGIHEDITERRKLEEQLRHSQKLEAIGQLVGGIAHDFNNMLTAIIGFAGMLQMKMKKDDPLMVNVEQVLEAAERGASLTRSLLVFGRKQAIYPRPVELNEIIEKVEKLLLRLIGEDIELRTVVADGELTVTADSLQMEQVLINLATNARDAMKNGGVLTIETGREKIDRKFIKAHGYGEPGKYAIICVSDTGEGMDEKTRERVFEPFFTTKEVGKGTGLGLAIVYSIVKQHNGYITVYSEVGKGTTFRIYLPMSRPAALEAGPVETVKPAAPAVSTEGTETVLVAEDDKNVRRLSRTLLETFGYTVIEAVNGEEAVQKFMENRDSIKLLVLDVIMPKKNGREAYEEIKKIAPEARVIFMSGYTADVMQAKGIIENGMVFVSKPVSPTDFMKKVREVLDR